LTKCDVPVIDLLVVATDRIEFLDSIANSIHPVCSDVLLDEQLASLNRRWMSLDLSKVIFMRCADNGSLEEIVGSDKYIPALA